MSEQLHPRTPMELQQHRFEQDVAKIAGELALWQMQLDLAYSDSPSYKGSLAGKAVMELEDAWPYTNSIVSVVGTAYTEDASGAVVKAPIAQRATHNGFACILHPEDHSVVLGHHLLTNIMVRSGVFSAKTEQSFVVARPEDVSFAFIGNKPDNSLREHKEIVHSINDGIRIFDNFAKHPRFYEASRRTQIKFMEAVLGRANSRLMNDAVTIDATIKNPLFYTRTDTAPEKFNKFSATKSNTDAFWLNGTLVGVGFLEMDVLASRAITSDRDWVDAQLGPTLQAIVEIGHDMDGIAPKGTPIFVPIATNKKMDLRTYIHG